MRIKNKFTRNGAQKRSFKVFDPVNIGLLMM
ncbi:hypothetical protein N478_23300 [Pseudoalteromonas luteoviolacea S4060-1]|uniref:Uncharacterized protein n=1 Tax=Pseudoalteromonas luteoviolacea S4060-1 TaxID=1365257 RepID=A0A161YPH6_9GAMM|nr:hypothetical protein N478_23300 [Pseudoalteromonas luteoviolacea S4060-1]